MFGEKKRIAMCIHCGKGVEYGAKDKSARQDAWQEMKQHDAMCPDNPLVNQRDQLREALSTHIDNLRDLLNDDECGPIVRKYFDMEDVEQMNAALKATEEVL